MNNVDLKLEPSIVDDKGFIKNIYQYYQHDLSEFNDNLQLGSTGLFDNSFVDSYYSEDNLIPLKITLENSVIGFIFCSTGKSVDYIIQDIFIMRNYRNRGLGRFALKQLFDLYPGKYGLDILIKNETAKLFWAHCLQQLGIDYTSYEVIEDGEPGIRFIFDSGVSFQPNDEKE